jgi:hypothetical protein
MGDLTSGIARVGIGRPFTIEHDSCAGGDGSLSDCPLLCVMPTRSTLRQSSRTAHVDGAQRLVGLTQGPGTPTTLAIGTKPRPFTASAPT